MAKFKITWVQNDEAVEDMASDGVDFEVEVFRESALPTIWEDNKDLNKKFRFRVLEHVEMSVPLSVEVYEVDGEEEKRIFLREYGEL